ncbi:hypothetical protein [Neolewinella persica]|uniref:hypothetical protein n=1 Tax=Neolewinella persica TaxID=70998 RepID=UPI0003709F4A|nr:hypothetical protein [Neolewinella persica]
MKYSFLGALLLCLLVSFSSCEEKDNAAPCRFCIEQIAESDELLAYKTATDDLFEMVLFEDIDMAAIQQIVTKYPEALLDEESAIKSLAGVKGGTKIAKQITALHQAKLNLQAQFDYLSMAPEKKQEVDRLFAKKHPTRFDANTGDRILEHRRALN